jgi:hypothetical protein
MESSDLSVQSLLKERHEVMQILGKALYLPRFCDDLESFPHAQGITEINVGERSVVELATLAANRLKSLERRGTFL